jgi:hypothetical protein
MTQLYGLLPVIFQGFSARVQYQRFFLKQKKGVFIPGYLSYDVWAAG